MTPNKPLTITLPAQQWERIFASEGVLIKDVKLGHCDWWQKRQDTDLAWQALRAAYESAIIAAIDEEGKK